MSVIKCRRYKSFVASAAYILATSVGNGQAFEPNKKFAFSTGLQLYATGVSIRNVNAEFAKSGLPKVDDVLSSAALWAELDYSPLNLGFEISYGGAGVSSLSGPSYSGISLSSFSAGLTQHLSIGKYFSAKTTLSYFSMIARIDQYSFNGAANLQRFTGSTVSNDLKAIEPGLQIMHKVGKSKKFGYGIFGNYYFVIDQTGWVYKQSRQSAFLPSFGNDNNLRVGVFCGYHLN